MATCPGCQSDLPEDLESGQCPHCNHAWGVLKRDGVGITDTVTVAVGWGAERSWLEQWGEIERTHTKLQNLYSSAAEDAREPTSVVKTFFIQCWHLSDWLRHDKATSVQKSDTDSLRDSEPDMKICAAMANSTKHHTLDKPEWTTARVSTITTEPTCQVTIEILRTSGKEYRDALELATSCMSIWRKFLASHGLNI